MKLLNQWRFIVDSNDSDGDRQKKIKNNLAVISDCAQKIYHLIPPGTTLNIEWLVQPGILTRENKQHKHNLIITRPSLNLTATYKCNQI